jgi:hypothetical protein
MASLSLVSTELREPYEPRSCEIVRQLASELRDDLALVKISPSLPKETYDTANDINELILATRLEGQTLFPISELPVTVYICQSKVPIDLNSNTIDSEQLSILDWGELRQAPI